MPNPILLPNAIVQQDQVINFDAIAPTVSGVLMPSPILLYDQTGNALSLMRTNIQANALVSALRTATTSSADLLNLNGRGLLAFLNVTAASGTGGLTLAIQVNIGGTLFLLATDTAAILATGTYTYILYPGAGADASARIVFSVPIPRSFRFRVTHGDATNYTYQLDYAIIL